MTSEQSKDFMRRFLEASVGNDPSAYMDLMAPDFMAHVPGGPKNREGFVQHMNVFNVAFSDKEIRVSDVISDGEKIVARVIWRGIHSGDFMGLTPTGRQIEIEAYIVEHLMDGKTVEHWSLFDQLTMMQQLGIFPTPQTR